MRNILQILAFFCPPPLNIWLLRLGSAKIGKHVLIHPGVLILSRHVEIGSNVRIRFGTVVNVRRLKIGDKSLMGYFIHVKGICDFKTGPACVIGPRTMINCDRSVTLGHYAGIGPSCNVFAHGSFLPTSEGYRTSFGAIELKDRAWVSMGSILGPGVTVGEGTNVMPGTVLLESVGGQRLVTGNPVKLLNIPLIKQKRYTDLEALGREILEEYREWVREFEGKDLVMSDGVLEVQHRRKRLSVSVDGNSDIVLLTRAGEKADGMYFNLADLTTDADRNRAKVGLEEYMRRYYGLTFL